MSSVPNRLYAARSPEGVELWIQESEMPANATNVLATLLANTDPAVFGGNVKAVSFTVGATPGIDFSGAVTNITVVKGIITAAS